MPHNLRDSYAQLFCLGLKLEIHNKNQVLQKVWRLLKYLGNQYLIVSHSVSQYSASFDQ